MATTTTTATKITKKQKFEMLRALVEDNDMLVEFIDHEIDLLERKSSKVDTKKSAEHEEIMGYIKSVLYEASASMKCGDITKRVNAKYDTDYQSQKISAMLKKMVEGGEVTKSTEKKETFFTLAD